MSFNLEIPLQRSNQLSAYIRQPTHDFDISIRSINTLTELQAEFLKVKKAHSTKMHTFQRRLQECIAFHRDTQMSLNLSRSRIANDRHSLSIERYEDLLEYNFKQIQWTKTSRINEEDEAQQDGDKLHSLQSQLTVLQQILIRDDQTQEKCIEQLESSIKSTSDAMLSTVNEHEIEILSAFKDTSNKINVFQSQFKNDLQALEQIVQRSKNQLSGLISKQIASLQVATDFKARQ